MQDATIIDAVEKITKWSPFPLTLFILYLGWRQVWVWGWQLRAMTVDRDFWRAQALRITSVAEQSTAPRVTRDRDGVVS